MSSESTIPPWPKGYRPPSPKPAAAPAPAPVAAPPPKVNDGFDPAAAASAEKVLAQRFESEPSLRVKVSVLGALQAHRNELIHSLSGAKAELAAWRKEHGGVESMHRLAVAGGQLVRNALSGNLKVWEGAGELATDAETLERAPIRDRLASLEHRLKEVDRAIRAVADGGQLPASADYRIRELSSALHGRPLQPAELMRERLGWLAFCEKHQHAEDGAEAYIAALEPYLQLRTSKGESLQTLKDGKASITGLVNQLILLGVLENGGRLVTSPQELHAVAGKVDGLQEKAPSNAKLAALSKALTPAALKKEEERVRAIVDDPALAPLRASADSAQRAFEGLSAQGQKGLFGRSVETVGKILDSPETWAMAASGALVSGTGARLLFGGTGTTADLILARRAQALTGSLVGKYAAGTLVDATLFHAGMNGFNALRGKSERVSWAPLDFAKTALMFEVLGAVGINAAGRQAAATKVGRAAQSGRYLAEEAGALTLLGVGEAYLRTGDLSKAADLLEENFQFLVAMRLVGGIQRIAGRPGGDAKLRELKRLEGDVASAELAYRQQPTRENLETAYAAFRAYGERYNAAMALLHQRGVLPTGPDARPVVRSRGIEQLEATADGIKQRLMSRHEGKLSSSTLRKAVSALDTVVDARRTGRDLSEAELKQALEPLVQNLRRSELGALRDAVRAASLDFGEVPRQQRNLFDGTSGHTLDLSELLSGAARHPETAQECAAAREALNSAQLRLSFEKDELLKTKDAKDPARAKELERLTALEERLKARRAELDSAAEHIRVTPPKPPPTPLELFHDCVKGDTLEAIARLEKKGESVPESLRAKLNVMEEVVGLVKADRSLPIDRLAYVYNTLLIDLSPAQLTALRDAIKASQVAHGSFVQMPRRLAGMPGRASEVASMLIGLSRAPVTAQEARNAQRSTAEEIKRTRKELEAWPVLAPELQPRLEELQRRHTQLVAEETALNAGRQLNALPSAPKNLKAAREQQAKVLARLGATEAKLSAQLAQYGSEAKLPTAERQQRARLLAERAGYERAASTLNELIPELAAIRRRGAWEQTAIVTGVSQGVAPIPGVFAVSADVGYKMSAKDFHTGKRTHELWTSQLVRSAIGGPGYFYSRSNRGLNANLSFPFAGLGIHPVLGRTAFVFIPGVFTFQMGSSGGFSLMVTMPSPIPGFFTGVSFAVVNPALANITGPALGLIYRGVDAGARYGRELAPYLSPDVRSALRNVASIRGRADAEGRALLHQQLLPILEEARAGARSFLATERAEAQGRAAGLQDVLRAARADAVAQRAALRKQQLRAAAREAFGPAVGSAMPV